MYKKQKQNKFVPHTFKNFFFKKYVEQIQQFVCKDIKIQK